MNIIKTEFSEFSDEDKILIIFNFKKSLLFEYMKNIKMEYFSDWYRQIYNIILHFVDKYDSTPSDRLPFVVNESEIADKDTKMGILALSQKLVSFYKKHKDFFSEDTYLSDIILKWVNKCSIESLLSKVQELSNNDATAEDLSRCIQSYKPVIKKESNLVNPLKDIDEYLRVIGTDSDSMLFQLPGAIGKEIGMMSRNEMLFVMSETGLGKSQVARWIGECGMHNGLNVLHLSLENDERTELKRYLSSFSKKPIYPGLVRIGHFATSRIVSVNKFTGKEITDDDEVDPKSHVKAARYKIKYFEKQMDAVSLEAQDISSVLSHARTFCNGGMIRLMCIPAETLTAKGLDAILDDLAEIEGYFPDIIIIDPLEFMLADNPKDKKNERLEQLNIAVKRIGAQRRCLMVLTAQIKREDYGKTVKKESVADNIGFSRAASYILGLSATKKDTAAGILRVNIVKNRERAIGGDSIIAINGMSIGQAILDSKYEYEVDGLEKHED